MYTTERLRFRAYAPSDQPSLLALYNDPRVAIWITDGFLVPRNADRFDDIMKMTKESVMFCIVEELKSGTFVGFTTFLSITEFKTRNLTWGICLTPTQWRKGFGQEIGKFMIDHAFLNLNCHRLSLSLLEGNSRAFDLYKRLGFVEEGRTRESIWQNGRWHDMIRMGMLDEEWTAKRRTHADKTEVGGTDVE